MAPATSAPPLRSFAKIWRFSRGCARLPIGLGHGILVEHHQGGHSCPYGRGKIGGREFLQVQLDHHVLGDLTAFGGPILQPVEPVLHLGDPAFEPGGQGFVGQGRPENGSEDFMDVGEPLNGIGEGLLVDLGGLARVCDRGWRGRWRRQLSDSWVYSLLQLGMAEYPCRVGQKSAYEHLPRRHAARKLRLGARQRPRTDGCSCC